MKKSESGFSLLEVLVAIVLASLFISVFAQVFAIARGSNRLPGELFASVERARSLLAGYVHSDLGGLAISSPRFREQIEISKLIITDNPIQIAPPIPATSESQQPTSSSQQSALPSQQNSTTLPQPTTTPQKELRAITVIITSPTGRRTELNGVTSTAP